MDCKNCCVNSILCNLIIASDFVELPSASITNQWKIPSSIGCVRHNYRKRICGCEERGTILFRSSKMISHV